MVEERAVDSFERIPEPKRKSVRIAEQILQQISSGAYRVGDLLPSERDLAARMSVSRNAIREALSALQIAGVVDIQVGIGTCVVAPQPKLGNLATAIDFARIDIMQIWEARKEVETALFRVAVGRVTEEHLAEAGRALEAMSCAVRASDVNQYLQANDLFHLAIADTAQISPLRRAVEDLMQSTTVHLLEDVNRGYAFANLEESLGEHAAILEALRTRDVEAGVSAISRHFDGLRAYLEQVRLY